VSKADRLLAPHNLKWLRRSIALLTPGWPDGLDGDGAGAGA
jgi:hypothetical protein